MVPMGAPGSNSALVSTFALMLPLPHTAWSYEQALAFLKKSRFPDIARCTRVKTPHSPHQPGVEPGSPKREFWRRPAAKAGSSAGRDARITRGRGGLRYTLSLAVRCPGGVPEEPRRSPLAGHVTCWSGGTCRRIPGSSRFSRGCFPGHNASGEASGTLGLPGAPCRAWVVARLPPFAEPSRPSLAPQKPSLWPPFLPILHPTAPRPAPEFHRDLTVALIPNFEPTCCRSLAARSAPCSQRSLGTSLSLITDQRYYGEVPMRLRWGYGG